jgi:hypothetical protein
MMNTSKSCDAKAMAFSLLQENDDHDMIHFAFLQDLVWRNSHGMISG